MIALPIGRPTRTAEEDRGGDQVVLDRVPKKLAAHDFQEIISGDTDAERGFSATVMIDSTGPPRC